MNAILVILSHRYQLIISKIQKLGSVYNSLLYVPRLVRGIHLDLNLCSRIRLDSKSLDPADKLRDVGLKKTNCKHALVVPLIILMTLYNQLCFAYPMPNPFPPFRIAGNLYYVGTDDLASYLIVTPKGNILINSDLEANVPMIKASIEKLGFKFSDTKILLISHAHLDHAAGSQLIKQQTNAQYMVMDADVPEVQSGGKSDFHYGDDASMYFPATKVDKVLHDGEKVQLGGTVLTAHLTAGHTKGCTTWSMQVTDHGKHYQVVILGSLGVNPGYKLINNTTYPNITQDYQHSIKALKALHCDIFLGAHAMIFNLKKKYDSLNHSTNNPFIDPKGYQKHIEQKEREFYIELQKQKSTGSP